MVTLKDVAKRAGVSVATVSYCINKKKNIKPETQLKVRAAIEELNYIPNFSARNLKNKASEEIGVILPDLDDLTNSEILKGIIAQADLRQFSVNIACSYNNPHNEMAIIEKFLSKNYAGIILMTCQTQNTAFFQKTFQKNEISNVFIMRLPGNISTNFLGFDNYSTIHFITERLLQEGYTDVALLVGSHDFFSESECVNGYSDAFDTYGIPLKPENILYTDMSKEGAFKVTMMYLASYMPQAIITSSQTIMDGVIEACSIHNIIAGENICLITLSEERWNQSFYHTNVIHTAASAYTLGEDSFRILMEEAISPQLYDRRFRLYKDNILGTDLPLPKPVFKPVRLSKEPVKTLHVASMDLPTIKALQGVCFKFLSTYNIQLVFDYFPLSELFEVIEQDTVSDSPMYDLYLSDVSWMRYFVSKESFLDITDLMNDIPELQQAVFAKNLSNARYHDAYYGFPIIGGTQFLFYRKDLFEDTSLRRQYKNEHKLSLRPPKTWTEFNTAAKFFTKEFNPDSPTLYGTAISSTIPEDFILELLTRIWGYGGSLFNNRGQLELNTPQNVRAFKNVLETTQFTPPGKNLNETTFEQIGNGSIAMAISFTEYASDIQNSLHPEFLSKIGYSMLPGNNPANVGWHFCVSKKTPKLDMIRKLFTWLCNRQNSYYETILCGQSTLVYPHTHHELLRLYPWLDLTPKGLSLCKDRFYPLHGKRELIKPADFEAYILNAFDRMQNDEISISEALAECQRSFVKKYY
ncbi:MAG: extracellular solute-binding protein [Blautia sp.]|nr:extracellular solute-binding protein [Blautia sp.]